jgi:tetratricopeptide (TPR) repeat protein
MRPNPRNFAVLALVALLALGAAGCNKLKARDLYNKGVQSFNAGQTEQAIEFFQQAKELDPTLLNAYLALAASYASQYIPGAPSEENLKRGMAAIEEFKRVLELDQKNLAALEGLGSIYYSMAGTPFDPEKFEEAKKYQRRRIEIAPDNPEPYYWIGVINWAQAFRANNEVRSKYNATARRRVAENEPLPPAVRAEFEASHGPMVEEGIENLRKALNLRQDYDDAMAYLNLLYRQKADIVTSAEEREQLLDDADRLVDRVREIKQKQMEAATKH